MRFLRSLVATAILLIVALILWANQWRYFQYPNELVRVNRFSGSAFRLTTGGWERMRRDPIADYLAKYGTPSPVMDTGMKMDTTPAASRAYTPLDSITAAERAGVGTDTPGRSLYDEYRRTHPIKTAH